MTGHERKRDRLLWSVVAAAAALILTTFVAAQFVAEFPRGPSGGVMLPRMPRPPANVGEVLRTLGIGSPIWYACFASAPLFVAIGRRFPFARGRRVSSAAVHATGVAILVLITAAVQYWLIYGGSGMGPSLSEYVRVTAFTNTLPFVTVAAMVHALVALSSAHERELETQRVSSLLVESQLEALTAQLQPHFLFNTLQGISTLITRDPVAADRMLTSLSDLLREVLRHRDQREVELSAELRVLEPYLDISRHRFGERLTVTVAIDDGVSKALVPFFILQPLVENAMHHGISSHAGAGTIEIAATREGDALVIAVTDDGPGTVSPDTGRGIGLANTEARLLRMYRMSQSITAGRLAGGKGFRVRVAVPYHEREQAPAGAVP